MENIGVSKPHKATGGITGMLAPLLIDGLTLLAYFYLLPIIIARFAERDAYNLLLVGAAYILMCGGVFLGKLLMQPAKQKPTEAGEGKMGCSAWFSIPFALFVLAMLLESSGALDSSTALGTAVDESTSGGGAASIFAIIVSLIIMALFPVLAFIRLKPTIPLGSFKHLALRLSAAAAINVMVLVTAAYWEWQLADAEPMDIALGGKILVFCVAYLVFLMFYAPPRLALIELVGNNWSYASFFIMLGVFVWQLMG